MGHTVRNRYPARDLIVDTAVCDWLLIYEANFLIKSPLMPIFFNRIECLKPRNTTVFSDLNSIYLFFPNKINISGSLQVPLLRLSGVRGNCLEKQIYKRFRSEKVDTFAMNLKMFLHMNWLINYQQTGKSRIRRRCTWPGFLWYFANEHDRKSYWKGKNWP